MIIGAVCSGVILSYRQLKTGRSFGIIEKTKLVKHKTSIRLKSSYYRYDRS